MFDFFGYSIFLMGGDLALKRVTAFGENLDLLHETLLALNNVFFCFIDKAVGLVAKLRYRLTILELF